MKNKIEIAVIFRRKKEKDGTITYLPDHITIGHQDEETNEFITKSGKKYPYMLNLEGKNGYGFRKRIIFTKESKNTLTTHPLVLIKEYAKDYFNIIKKNTYQFITPYAGDYEEINLYCKNEKQTVFEPDLNLAKLSLKKNELFDAKILAQELKDTIIGQDKAIEDIISILWQNTRSNVKNNILLIGPTGVGKTEIIRNIAKRLNVPSVVANATSLTASGYIGKCVDDILLELLKNADNNLSSASRGIIFLDEIDKKNSSNSTNKIDEIGSGSIQDELLKLLEDGEYVINLGTTILPNYKTISTKNITIIASGAFTELLEKRGKPEKTIGFENNHSSKETTPITTEELYQFGLKKELLGRLPNIIELNPLTEDDLIQILKNKNNQTLEEKKHLLNELGITLSINDTTIKQIAHNAFKKNTGARGLIGSVEAVFKEPMTLISQEPNNYQELILEPVTKENPKGYRLIKKNNQI